MKTIMPGKVDDVHELLRQFSFVWVTCEVRWVNPAEGTAASLYLLWRWFGLVRQIFSLSFSLMIVFFFSFFDLKEAPIISDKKCNLHLFVLFNFTVVNIC